MSLLGKRRRAATLPSIGLMLLGALACSSQSSSDSARRADEGSAELGNRGGAEGAAEEGAGSGDEDEGAIAGDAAGPGGGQAPRVNDPGVPEDDFVGAGIEYAVPGAPCESSADCRFAPGEWNFAPNGKCEATECGEPVCHDFVPCAAPSEPALLCSCDGEVIDGAVGCDQIRNYAFVLGMPFAETTFDGGCGDEPPEQWLVRLEVTGWDEHEGAEVTVTGPRLGDNFVVTVQGGAISLPLDTPASNSTSLVLYFDSNDDGNCNEGELSFATMSEADAITGDFVVSPVAEGTICD